MVCTAVHGALQHSVCYPRGFTSRRILRLCGQGENMAAGDAESNEVRKWLIGHLTHEDLQEACAVWYNKTQQHNNDDDNDKR